MLAILVTERQRVADRARKLLAGALSWDAFMDSMPDDVQDEDIAELIDLVVHEPSIGGLFGVSPGEHEAYVDRIVEVIERLEV